MQWNILTKGKIFDNSTDDKKIIHCCQFNAKLMPQLSLTDKLEE